MNFARYRQLTPRLWVASLALACAAASAQIGKPAPVAAASSTGTISPVPAGAVTVLPAPPMPINLQLVQVGLQLLVVFGFFLAFQQVLAARRQARANVLIRMFEEWNEPALYDSVRYIHQLRREWKQADPSLKTWPALAEAWVNANIPTGPATADGPWLRRRRAAQFLDKVGYMLHAKYITPDDLFAVVPEASRLLLVLDPLEQAIVKHFRDQEVPSAEWDRPSSKLYLQHVDKAALLWFEEKGHKA
jgi:hypothetical protein